MGHVGLLLCIAAGFAYEKTKAGLTGGLSNGPISVIALGKQEGVHAVAFVFIAG